MRIGPSGARRFFTNSAAPAMLIKYPRTFDSCCPPFYRGQKCPKFWLKFRPQSFSDRHIIERRRFIGKQKQTCQGPTIDLSPYQTWDRWVPQLWEPLAQWVPQRIKVEHFLYILRSSGPRRVQRQQCYTTCWGRSCCKKATVPYLPIRPLHFKGAKIRSPTSVTLGLRHISEIITARKLKFYVHLHRVEYTLGMWKFSARGVRGRSAPSVNLGPRHMSETIRARKLEFYTQSDRVKYSFRAWQFFR